MIDQELGIFGCLPEFKSAAERAQLSQVKWEAAMLGRLLRYYDVAHMAPMLRTKCEEATGLRRLLFTWFHNAFPSFPVWLVFRKVPYLHTLKMEDFLHRFGKTQVFDGWVDARAAVPDWWLDEQRPIGLVFEYLHGMGAAIMTDCERPMSSDTTRIVKSFRGKPYYFEALDNFLEGLGWRPLL
jgi:hypothetical protein